MFPVSSGETSREEGDVTYEERQEKSQEAFTIRKVQSEKGKKRKVGVVKAEIVKFNSCILLNKILNPLRVSGTESPAQYSCIFYFT